MSSVEQFEVFVRVVALGSFTAAADALSLPKSTVSRQVSRLEDRLGVRLLHRTTRTVKPTEAGQMLYDRAQRIVADIQEAEELVARNQAVPRGHLRVTAPLSFGHLYLGPLIAAFMAAHPQVTVDVDLSDRKVDLVEEGDDVAVRVGILDDSSLVARRLGCAGMVLCASPAYLEARGRPTSAADLGHHEFLRYAYSPNQTLRVKGGGSVSIHGKLVSNNGELLRDVAVAGGGLVVLPRFIVADQLRDGRLVTLLDDLVGDTGGVYLLYPHHRNLSSKVRAFVDVAARHFASPPWER